MTAKHSKLFASLLVREYYAQRCWGGYLYFLRSNIRHGDKFCPYHAAVRMISGAV